MRDVVMVVGRGGEVLKLPSVLAGRLLTLAECGYSAEFILVGHGKCLYQPLSSSQHVVLALEEEEEEEEEKDLLYRKILYNRLDISCCYERITFFSVSRNQFRKKAIIKHSLQIKYYK